MRSDLRSIPGWLNADDEAMLRFILEEQCRQGVVGDLAELGVYKGKSAVLIGDYVQPGETFTVVDLFGDPAGDEGNLAENAAEYPGLTETEFRTNYGRFHSRLPTIIKGPTTSVLEHAGHGSHRFVHVDASHMYDHVRGDVDTAKALLGRDGLVVFDDFRSPHTPGTAAAVWEAVDRTGLVPIAISEVKFYGTWSDGYAWHERLCEWLPVSHLANEVQMIAGYPVHRVWPRRRMTMGRRVATALTPPAALVRVDRLIKRLRGHE